MFADLKREVVKGRQGGANSVPIGLGKFNDFAAFRPRIFQLLFSSAGAGKTSLAMTMMLNACEAAILGQTELKPRFILFSMERSIKFQLAKWLIRRIFKDKGKEIYMSKLLGWNDSKLSDEEFAIFEDYEVYIDTLLNEYIEIHEGAKTPEQIEKILVDYAHKNGKYENEVYISNNPLDVTTVIIDHGNLTKKGSRKSKKEGIDDLVAILQSFRDKEGYGILWISQINRTLTGAINGKEGDQEPSIDHIKESSDIADAADLVVALFDPLRFRQSSKTNYVPTDFVDPKTGENYFRSVQILKNSLGPDQVRIALAFNGFCGDFKDLPPRKELADWQYAELLKSVKNKSYFLCT